MADGPEILSEEGHAQAEDRAFMWAPGRERQWPDLGLASFLRAEHRAAQPMMAAAL
jgi:hypothetical protein